MCFSEGDLEALVFAGMRMSALGLDGVVGGDVEKSVSPNNGTYLTYLSVNPQEEMEHTGAGSCSRDVLLQPGQRAISFQSDINYSLCHRVNTGTL